MAQAPAATVALSTGPAALHMCLYAARIPAPHTRTTLEAGTGTCEDLSPLDPSSSRKSQASPVRELLRRRRVAMS